MTKERAEEECTTMGEAYTEGYQQGKADGKADAIDEFETRILGNCSLMLKDGERVIVIRQDIFKFIIEQMQKGAEND